MPNHLLSRVSRCAAVLAVLLIVLSVAGCGSSNKEMKTKSYDKDGLLGTTRANPNYPTNPDYHSYSADTQLIKQTLQQIPGIRASAIKLNGPNAYVSLDLADDTSLEDAMRIKNDAQNKVSQMMPRYNVKVSTNKSRMLQKAK